MEAKPKTDEFTVQEAADMLQVGKQWLFDWLKTNGHMNKQRVPIGNAAAKGYLRLSFGQHTRPGIGQRTHYRPVITTDGLNWLTQEVAKAKLEEQYRHEKEAG